MPRVKVIVTHYGFKRPPLLTKDEFVSYKQIFQIEANYNMAPKRGFWEEFVFVKWCLICLIVGGILAAIWDFFVFVPCLAIVALALSMVTGTAQSMFSYQGFLNQKNRYYDRLRQAIIASKTYDEFKIAAGNL